MSGHVVACLRVGALGAGLDQVELEQEVTDRAGSSVSPTTVPSGGLVGEGPPITLSLSPAAGKPGSRVTVTGTLKTPVPRSDRSGYADLCWDGCRDGLQYMGVKLRWISTTVFHASLVIPDAPWIETGPARVHRVESGRYPIGIQCLETSIGCALGGSEGDATFNLQATPPGPKWCPNGPACAHLSVTPRAALPGGVVRVTGNAPLVSIIGSNQPFTFQLGVVPGPPTGPAVRMKVQEDTTAIDLGHGTLTVEPAPTWASLPPAIPLAELSAGLPAVSAGPSGSSVVAWCARGSVAVSGPGGQTQIPTTSVTPVLAGLGIAFGSPPTCSTAVPFVAEEGDDIVSTVVAAFAAAPEGNGPDSAEVPLFTVNGGATWALLPAPAGESFNNFAGFRVQGDDLEAVYMPEPTGGPPPPQPPIEISSDGSHWQPASLACPTSGPCVTFGSFVLVNCAMTEGAQILLRSADDGQRWLQAGWPGQAGECAPSELVATSPTTEFLVDSASPYTLTRSTDAGATWADIALPSLPGAQPGVGIEPGPGGITVLPSGALLAVGQRDNTDAWELLAPGATAWCPVRTVPTSVQQTADDAEPEVIGMQLWWLPAPTNQSTPASEHLAVSVLSC
jgi:photosystem II stability/assembly factor-like uncharacterized protein